MLSAHQRGLGSFWSSAPVTCSAEFAAWLGMDATHRGLGMVYLGFPLDGVKATSVRVPLSERVTFHAD
jgi:nitroreductase